MLSRGINLAIVLIKTTLGQGNQPKIIKARKPRVCRELSALCSKRSWRRPTLAEARQPLPLARLRLTAEFGMGSGRSTALWPPTNLELRIEGGAQRF